MSLRSLEDFINDTPRVHQEFKAHYEHKKQVSHSGLAYRIQTMPVCYPESIYEHLVSHYHSCYDNSTQQALNRFDSTLIRASSELLSEGLNCGGSEGDRHIKVSVGMRGSIPSSIRFCQGQDDSSEDRALGKAIKEACIPGEDIVLFDRGISRAQTFEELNERHVHFITRLNEGRNHIVLEQRTLDQEKNQTADLTVTHDQVVLLYSKYKKPVNSPVRLIQAINAKGQILWFLTNLMEMGAHEVATLYKRRWDIEVLFKFMKQQLQFKHFLSYTNHGMQVYLYLVLCAALLFFIYKRETGKTGFKLAFFSFLLDLEKAYMIDLVILSGGDPDKVRHKL
jgi:hypothetical protein